MNKRLCLLDQHHISVWLNEWLMYLMIKQLLISHYYMRQALLQNHSHYFLKEQSSLIQMLHLCISFLPHSYVVKIERFFLYVAHNPSLIILAGTPTTVTLLGISFVTTAPAPILLLEPIFFPGITVLAEPK